MLYQLPMHMSTDLLYTQLLQLQLSMAKYVAYATSLPLRNISYDVNAESMGKSLKYTTMSVVNTAVKGRPCSYKEVIVG